MTRTLCHSERSEESLRDFLNEASEYLGFYRFRVDQLNLLALEEIQDILHRVMVALDQDFLRRVAAMGEEDRIVQFAQRMLHRQRLLVIDVEAGGGELAGLQRVDQRSLGDDR